MAGKRFPEDFDRIDKIKTTDKLLINDSKDGVDKYVTASQFYALLQEQFKNSVEETIEGFTDDVLGSVPVAMGEGESSTVVKNSWGPNKAGKNAFAEGYSTEATGEQSHTEGYETLASGKDSHAEGHCTSATNHSAHSEGTDTVASGWASHAEGMNTKATNHNGEHAEGKYNKSNTGTIHSVGIGTSESNRKNAHEITEDGKHYILGVGGYDGTNPDKATDVATELTELSAVIGLEGVNSIDLSNANSGYISAKAGNIIADTGYKYTNPIQVKKGQVVRVLSNAATSVAVISWTDANATYREPALVGRGNVTPEEYYYVADRDGLLVVCYLSIRNHAVTIYSAKVYEEISKVSEQVYFNNTEIAKLKPTYISDDLRSSATNATKQGVQTIQGTYGKDSAKYKVDASAFGNTTGVCHIAFDFKINEDVNIGEIVDKSFFRIEKDTWYADFVLRCGATSVFEGKEAKGSHTLTTTRSGMPYFNSCFGTRSNWQTAGDRLNLFMDTRSFRYDDYNKSHCYKPLCGKDLFSIQLIAVDSNGNELNTLSQEAQTIYQNWQDAYVEVTSAAVNVVSQTNAINETFAYANYSTMTALFAAIYTKLHNKIGNGVKWSVTDIGTSYYASETPNLVKCKIYLSSEHPSSNNSTFYDAFPAYLSHAIDDSWHTFELVSRADQDTMYFCIDGQYYGTADSRNWSIDTIRYIFKNATLIFGGELNVTFRNLLIESDSYQHAEVGKGVHYIISKRNPYILCLFLHEMYYAPNVGGDFSSYMTFESGGGKIPDSLKNPNANYVGDDYIQESRKTVTFPSWSIEDVISRLHDKGYMCISKKDLPKVMSGEICSPKNRYYIMDIDDHQTYIYDREDCRNIFTRYNCRPCFANELGFYLTKEISDELAGYDVANFIESYCKDTNEHRLALQKRLQSLLHSGWTLDIHGSKEGYTFQGKTYQQMKAEILNAINISKFYGLPINAWCYAANYYTPNAVKLLKSMGIEYGTSTASQPIGKCRDNGFLPRIMITTNVANNIKVII